MLEYLKQFKNKRLVPQFMVVFYTGSRKWEGPLKLSDYLEIPKELKPYFNDWKIYLVDVKDIDTSKIKDKQTRYFIEAIQNMYKGNYDKLHRKIKMNRNNFIYAAIITGSLDLIKDLPEGDEIDMCEGMERMAEGFRSEGRTEGRKEGKLEEKKNTLKEQLIIKLGAVSSRLEEQLTNASLSTVIAVFENIIACTMELLNIERKKAVIINFILITVLSLSCALGFNVLSHIQPLGAGSTILDLEDFIVSQLLLPLGSLVYLLFCTSKYGWGFENYQKEANIG